MHWLPILRTRVLAWHGDPLAALISLETLQNILNVLGYPAVTLFIMIESTGIPFPGETMLLLASFYAAVDHHLQIPIIIACSSIGAILGDNFGYYIGYVGGRPFVERFGRYLFLKPQHLDRAEKFFAKHGDKTVFFGRFIAVLRTWSAFLAGVNKMHWRTFLIYNAAGGILWSTIFGTLGYLAGRIFHDNFTQVERLARTVSWGGGALVVLAAIVLAIIFYRRAHRIRIAAQGIDEPSEQEADKTTSSKAPLVTQADRKVTEEEHAPSSSLPSSNEL